MQRKPDHNTLLAGVLVLSLLFSGCEREPAVDQDTGAGPIESVFQDNVVKLDTLIFINPVRMNGNVRFDLLGTPPQIKAGDIVFYPGGDGLVGQVVTASVIGSRMLFQLDHVGFDKIFKSVSIRDTLSKETLKSRIRTDAGTWNSDTLALEKLYLFDGFWQLKGLQVQFNTGKFHSGSSIGKFFFSGQGQNPWFDRCMLDFNYSFDFSGELVVRATSAMDASDSLLVEKSVYGPYMINGFPVTYQVNTWLGFHVVTERDTAITFGWLGTSRGKLSLSYNYWETWKFTQDKLFQSADVSHFNGPMFTGYRYEIFISQVITPYFCGEPSISLSNRITGSIDTEVTIPNWQSTQTILSNGSMWSPDGIFKEFAPARLDIAETLLYSESQNSLLDNQRPTASLVMDPAAGFTDTNFKFDASGCTDIETAAELLAVRWDFDGDNHFDTEFSTDKIAYYRYSKPDIYRPILEVQDEKGATSRIATSVEVSLSTSAPIAHFTITPESGRISDIFIFNADQSYDAEDQVNQLKVRWDYNGDSIWDTSWSTRKIEYYVFREEGRYVAKLEVLDTQGLTGSTTRILNVAWANIKPTAFFTVDPLTGDTGTRFNFDAAGSADPEDNYEKLQVRWDWDNDGTYDTEYRTVKTIQHIFPVAGRYTVVMEVIDTEGYGSTYAQEILVTNPNTPPEADFTITPKSGKVDADITFDASVSTDAEDTPDELQVRWDWNNDNIFDTDFTTDKIVVKRFSEAGTFIIKLEVKDSGGLTDLRVKLVEIR